MLSVVAIILASGILLSSFVIVQSLTETNVRKALLEQQKTRQVDNTNSLAHVIGSDLDTMVKSLLLLAGEPVMQAGQLDSDRAISLVQAAHKEIGRFTIIRGVTLLDQNNIIVNTSSEELREAIGLDRSDQKYVIETRRTMQPYISPAFVGALGEYVIATSVPIMNRDTGKYQGLAVVSFSVQEYFESRNNFPPSSVIAFDREANYIAVTVPEFLGQNYFGERVQTRTSANPELNALYTDVLSGKAASTVFVSPVTNDERFVTGAPVFYRDQQVMSVALTTPTAAVYSKVNDILFAQQVQTVSLLVAVIGAILVFLLYQSKSNRTLETKVKERTQELQAANEQLRQHDKLQREFINIAAHELRTPVQPLLGAADLMEQSLYGKDSLEVTREDLNMIIRNAKRLERLSSDILEVSRIESGTLKIHKEPIDLVEKIRRVVVDSQPFIAGKNIKLVFEENSDEPLMVEADKIKLFEVISNIVRNAVKFTEEGTIVVSLQKKDNHAVVTIKDTGKGIDPEIMPRLFEKFATKSDSGTGIGLFISRAIIDAHGGKIWAQNNKEAKGATFSFSLPLATQPPATHEPTSKSDGIIAQKDLM